MIVTNKWVGVIVLLLSLWQLVQAKHESLHVLRILRSFVSLIYLCFLPLEGETVGVADIKSILHLRYLPRGSMDMANISVDGKNFKLHRI